MGLGVVLGGYFALPVLLLSVPIEADTHYLETLQDSKNRVGHTVAFDRGQYLETQNGAVIEYYGGRVAVEPLEVESPATVSLRGVFIEENQIRATAYHVYAGGLRNYASYLGLALIAFIWGVALWERVRRSVGLVHFSTDLSCASGYRTVFLIPAKAEEGRCPRRPDR
jgi:hypothetical protein